MTNGMTGYWYLATPYTKYPEGLDAAWELACSQSALLISAGVHVFSPIAHTHPIAMIGHINPLDHSIWLPADMPMMEAAHGLVVVMADGWKKSVGIKHEIGFFHEAEKPIFYMFVNEVPPPLVSYRKERPTAAPREMLDARAEADEVVEARAELEALKRQYAIQEEAERQEIEEAIERQKRVGADERKARKPRQIELPFGEKDVA